VRLDPDWAKAHAGLAEAWSILSDYADVSVSETDSRVREAAGRALELDPGLVEVHASLGIAAAQEYRWEEAEREFLRVLEERPGYATAHQWYAWMLVMMGRHEEAIEEIRKARDADPVSVIINSNVGQMLHYAGHDEEALEELNRALEMAPDFPTALRHKALVYLNQGRFDEAISILRKLKQEFKWRANLAYALGRAGRVKEATDLLDQIEPKPMTLVAIAQVQASLGRNNEALTTLERSWEEAPGTLRYLKGQPEWKPLHEEPRYRALLRKMNLE
jgi:serine/threonine-protein kinase